MYKQNLDWVLIDECSTFNSYWHVNMVSPSLSWHVQAVSNLNMPDILHAVPPRTFNRSQWWLQAEMDEHINLLPQSEYNLLVGVSQAKKQWWEALNSAHPHEDSIPTPSTEEDFFLSLFLLSVDVNISQSLSMPLVLMHWHPLSVLFVLAASFVLR